MLDLGKLRQVLTAVLDRAMPACAAVEYRLVGTGASLLQGVALPARDVDLLVKERAGVDTFSTALRAFKRLTPPVWLDDARQYFAEYEVDGVGVGVSTVEWETDSDGIECLGRGPWEHYAIIRCGVHAVPAVALELRLVSELARDRPDRYEPLIEFMRARGCDIELVKRGMQARNLLVTMQVRVIERLMVRPGE